MLYNIQMVSRKKKNRKRWKNIYYALLYVLDELIAAESEGELVKLNDVWERYLDYAENYNTHLSGSYRYKNTFGI